MSLREVLNIPSNQVTDEAVYRERRHLLKAMAMAPN